MSRIGKLPITLPDGVGLNKDGSNIQVKGPKGELTTYIDPSIDVELKDGTVSVTRPSDNKTHRSLHGLSRTLIANMVEGVTKGFEKKLEIRGVGYRAEMRGKNLMLYLGYSHPIFFIPPEVVEVKVEGNTNLTVSGIDKALVGQVAAKIRSFRKPEPYKGKGIRYVGEYVVQKAGKTAGK